MDYKLQVVGVQSHLEIGSLDDKSLHDFDDENLSTPEREKTQKPGHAIERNISFSLGSPVHRWRATRNNVCKSIRTVLLSNKLNLLLPLGPLAVLVYNLSGHNGWVFFLSLLGITPLAERLGYATEQLAFYTGPTVGGLLNATFGNATELIMSIYALKRGMTRVVQLSMLGSILSNMLLVLGCSLFFGGLVYRKGQVFTKEAAVVDSGLLFMSIMCLLFPAVLHQTHTEVHFGKSELSLSRFSSCIMLVAYVISIFFQLKSQKNYYLPLHEESRRNVENTDNEDEIPEISKREAYIWLAIVTTWVSFLSDYLVDSMEGASDTWNMSVSFVSVILPPIASNAASIASCIMFAVKDKLDMSLGVALSSSTQISMFVIPFCVVIGWIVGCPMDLNFQLFETASLFMTVAVVSLFLQHGTSNYLKGLILILCYAIIAASFYVHEDASLPDG